MFTDRIFQHNSLASVTLHGVKLVVTARKVAIIIVSWHLPQTTDKVNHVVCQSPHNNQYCLRHHCDSITD